MKKIYNILLVSLFSFFLCSISVSAKEMSIDELNQEVINANPNAGYYYLVGEYVFTSTHNPLTLEDLMLAARTIEVSENSGATNKDKVYNEMSTYQLNAEYDDDFNLIGYSYTKNFTGKSELPENVNVKYIDYELIKEDVVETYDVVFVTENSRKSVNVESGKKVDKPEDPVLDGYSFDGWYLEDTKFDFETPITTNIELTAKFTKTTCTVSFEGMDNTSDFEDKSLTCGDVVGTLASATSTDRGAFVNWYLNGEVFDLNTKINDDITLLARFEKDFIHTVTFYDGTEEFTELMQEVTEGNTATKPTDPSKKGYIFVDWSTGKNVFDFTSKIMADLQLYAEWDPVVAIANNEITFLEALNSDNVSVIQLATDITLTNPITVNRNVEIAGGGYTLKADYTSDVTSFIEINAPKSEVVMDNVIVDANSKGRAIRINYGKLVFKDSTVKNGLNNSESLYAAGIYVNNASELEFINSTATGNTVYTDYQDDNYIEYTSDIWVGSIATVNITSGNIGNMFVNGNKYGNGLATVNGGTIENVYLEYSDDHGSTLNYVGGTINNIYISTTTEGVSNKTENPVIGTYTNVE